MPRTGAGAGVGELQTEELVELVLLVVGGDVEQAGDVAQAFPQSDLVVVAVRVRFVSPRAAAVSASIRASLAFSSLRPALAISIG